MSKKRIICYAIGTVVAAVAALVCTCNYLVVGNAEGRLYSDAASAPVSDVGLLPGTTRTERFLGSERPPYLCIVNNSK